MPAGPFATSETVTLTLTLTRSQGRLGEVGLQWSEWRRQSRHFYWALLYAPNIPFNLSSCPVRHIPPTLTIPAPFLLLLLLLLFRSPESRLTHHPPPAPPPKFYSSQGRKLGNPTLTLFFISLLSTLSICHSASDWDLAFTDMYLVPPPKRPDPLSGSALPSDALRIFQTWKGSNVCSLFSFSSFHY